MKTKSTQLLLWIETTEHCQLKCRFCYNSWRDTNPSKHKHMSVNTVNEIISFAETELKNYDITCALAGGDLTAHPDWKNLVSSFSKIGNIFVVTHGTELKEEDFLLLSETKSEIQFSIPSLQPESYKFHTGGAKLDTALVSLARAKYFDLETSVSAVITAENVTEICDFVELGNELDLSYIVLNKFMPAGRGVHYNEQFSLDNESFLRGVESAKIKNNDKTRLLVSGSFQGVRARKTQQPKITITCDGDIQICSLASSSIGKVSEKSSNPVMDKYISFWTGNSTILGCDCSRLKNIS